MISAHCCITEVGLCRLLCRVLHLIFLFLWFEEAAVILAHCIVAGTGPYTVGNDLSVVPCNLCYVNGAAHRHAPYNIQNSTFYGLHDFRD